MRSIFAGLLLCLATTAVPRLADAQSIVTGTWSGTVTNPSGEVKPVTYTVTRSGDSLSVTLSETAGGPPVAFANVRVAGDTLLFDWRGGREGERLICKLVRQEDGAYEGSCRDSESREGRMRMVPPPRQ
jgi:hypothetical protein